MFFRGSVEKASSWRWMKLKKKINNFFKKLEPLYTCTAHTFTVSDIRQMVLFMGCLDSLELAEDVGVLGGDAGRLQDGDPEGESAADLQVR